jgi:hypothetical protein
MTLAIRWKGFGGLVQLIGTRHLQTKDTPEYMATSLAQAQTLISRLPHQWCWICECIVPGCYLACTDKYYRDYEGLIDELSARSTSVSEPGSLVSQSLF